MILFQFDPQDQNGPDLETKIEEMKQNIRRAETAKMKAEARLECLRSGGINVDEWLQEAETLNVQEIQRSTSSLSIRTEGTGVCIFLLEICTYSNQIDPSFKAFTIV